MALPHSAVGWSELGLQCVIVVFPVYTHLLFEVHGLGGDIV